MRARGRHQKTRSIWTLCCVTLAMLAVAPVSAQPPTPTPTATCPDCRLLGSPYINDPRLDPPYPEVGQQVTVTFRIHHDLPFGFGCDGGCTIHFDTAYLSQIGSYTFGTESELVYQFQVLQAGTTNLSLDVTSSTELECYRPGDCSPYWQYAYISAHSGPRPIELYDVGAAPLTATPTNTMDTPTRTPTATRTPTSSTRTPSFTATASYTASETCTPTPTLTSEEPTPSATVEPPTATETPEPATPTATVQPIDLVGGVSARFSQRPAVGRARGRIKFRKDPTVAASGRYDCEEAPRTLTLRTDQQESVVTLPCDRWSAVAAGLKYVDRAGTAGGVTRLLYGKGTFEVSLREPHFSGVPGPIQFLEVEISIDGNQYCGRFHQFGRNEAEKLAAIGPTVSCEP